MRCKESLEEQKYSHSLIVEALKTSNKIELRNQKVALESQIKSTIAIVDTLRAQIEELKEQMEQREVRQT